MLLLVWKCLKSSRPVIKLTTMLKDLLSNFIDYFLSVDENAKIAIVVFLFFVTVGIIDVIFAILKFIYKHIILRITTLIYDFYFFIRHYNKK